MPNCWAILEIPPTYDVEEISRVRRALIRKWHPDTVASPEQQSEYTARCAAINAAYDEAVQIVAVRERVLKTSFANIDAELRRSNRERAAFSSSLALRAVPSLAAWLSVIYLLGFRYTFPATAIVFLFLAGVFIAAAADLLVYRLAVRPLLSFLGCQRSPILPWALLELANLLVLSFWFPDSERLLQAGLILAIPLWRSWRWVRGTAKTPRSPSESYDST
jgi:hypothetical protein